MLRAQGTVALAGTIWRLPRAPSGAHRPHIALDTGTHPVLNSAPTALKNGVVGVGVPRKLSNLVSNALEPRLAVGAEEDEEEEA